MRIASEMLTALAVLGIDESALSATTAPAVTSNEVRTMATLNHTDLKSNAPARKRNKPDRPLEDLYTTPLILAMADGNEIAADEAWHRLQHKRTLKPHNARRLQKAMDAFRVDVPGYLDPEAMAEAIKDAQASADAADAAGAESWPSAEPVETAVVVRSEDAELRSQVWALTIAVQQMAARLETLA